MLDIAKFLLCGLGNFPLTNQFFWNHLPDGSEKSSQNPLKIQISDFFQEVVRRKRLIEMPRQKTCSTPAADLGDRILKDETVNGTRTDRLRRFETGRSLGEQVDRSAILSSTESSHTPSLASASPRSFSSADVDDGVHPLPEKRTCLEHTAIHSLLDSLHGSGSGD